jgi:LmbE family N-acetylglucosaminyl deacetylase
LERADLLALPTHADDEHLFFGGILPTYAGERGLAVQVAYMTNHWGERYRPHELLNGLWTVGVTAYPLIGPFADLYVTKESLSAAEQTYGREAVLEFQVELLRRFKPKVVVGHDLAGEYGHGAHMLNAATLVDALALSGDETAYPDSAERWGLWETPKAYLHLYAENGIVMDWNLPLERFDGKTAYEMAVEGFARHRSQTEYFSVRQDGSWQDCRKFGLVHSLVGPDAAMNDLFENIDLSPEPEPEPTPVPVPLEPLPPQDASRAPEASPQEQADDTDRSLPVVALVVAGVLALTLVSALVFMLAGRNLRGKGGARRRM